ncbi:anti-sigma-D factor RsdA [Nocardia sp. NBC_01388]|uniref:anti-sigma-D factor RsdA n=1 Tax=Nocardia sp. NBC_01388 TaxID=2903596 RepID=UPI0032487640
MARDGERGRGDWKRLGSQNSGPYAEASGDTGPVDIAAVRRDDALIDAISGDGPVQTGTGEEYQLAALLANWRAEILEEPMPAGPDLDTIVAAVNQEIGARDARIGAQSGGRLRLVRPLLGAAAALALIIGGLSAFSYNANPGDPLWRVKEVVFSEQAQSTVVARADDALTQAQQLISDGHPEQAQAAMESASANASQVNDDTKKTDLQNRWQVLLTQLKSAAPSVYNSLVPTTSPSSAITTLPPVTVVPNPANPSVTVNPTLPPETHGGGTTVDPRAASPVEPEPSTAPHGGGITPPVTVPTVPPSVDVTEPPVTVPPQTSPASEPGGPAGGGTAPAGGQQPVTQPPVEKPSPAPPVTLVPTVPSVPLGGLPK